LLGCQFVLLPISHQGAVSGSAALIELVCFCFDGLTLPSRASVDHLACAVPSSDLVSILACLPSIGAIASISNDVDDV